MYRSWRQTCLRLNTAFGLAYIVAGLTGCGEQLEPSGVSGGGPSEQSPFPAPLAAVYVGCPAGAVRMATSDNWATKVNAAAAGTVFCVASGTHLNANSVVPKSGMQFIAATQRGATLDGRNTQQYAFQTLRATPSNVVIRGLVIRNYATPAPHGTIQGDNGAGWIIEDNEVAYNNYMGVRPGRNTIVRRNYIHHNRLSGISCYRCDGARIEYNTLTHNPPVPVTQTAQNSSAAQIKIVATVNVTVRQNQLSDGQHKGIWFDFGNRGVKIDTNTIVRHGLTGIWQEQGFDAKIRGNTITACAIRTSGFDPTWIDGAGIQMTNSPNVEIAYNTISDCLNGVGIMSVSGYPSSGAERNYVADLYVHHNTVTMATGRTGIQQSAGTDSVFTHWNNHFTANTYNTGTAARAAFAWLDGNRTFTQWQGYGHDLSGVASP